MSSSINYLRIDERTCLFIRSSMSSIFRTSAKKLLNNAKFEWHMARQLAPTALFPPPLRLTITCFCRVSALSVCSVSSAGEYWYQARQRTPESSLLTFKQAKLQVPLSRVFPRTSLSWWSMSTFQIIFCCRSVHPHSDCRGGSDLIEFQRLYHKLTIGPRDRAMAHRILELPYDRTHQTYAIAARHWQR